MVINISKQNKESVREEQKKENELEEEKKSVKTTRDKSRQNSKRVIDKINDFLLRFSRVPTKEKLFFVQHLGIMLKAGISLTVALKTLAKQSENKLFAKILNDIKISVEKGISLAESLRAHKKIFGELFVNMVESGEISGKLEDVLGQLFIQIKKQHELISKVKGALTYPVVIVLAMGGIGTFMMIAVVPKITSIFEELSTELPLPTKILIAISNVIVEHGLLSGLSFVIFVAIIIQTLRTRTGKYYFQIILLNMPVISPIIKKINLARFARTVSSLLKTDIMVIKTFQITANVLGNLHYRKALVAMSEEIKKGGTINEVITLYPRLFPPVVTQMVAVGEQTGELDNILQELAEFYESEVDIIMNNLPSIIEPLLILLLGTGVGAMAVAIIMPMYSLTTAV